QRVHEDLGGLLAAVEDVAEQDAVVVAVELGAEHGDVELVGRAAEDLLDHAGPGHAVPDHDELSPVRLDHASPTPQMKKPARAPAGRACRLEFEFAPCRTLPSPTPAVSGHRASDAR